MNLYGISGLGADRRVFDFLELTCPLIPIEWIEPLENESIEAYSLRLSEAIDTEEDFVLIGVSFGGLVAVEISKILKPRQTILISSAETKDELRGLYRGAGKTGLLKALPTKLFDPPRRAASFIFGTKRKALLNSILDDTDLKFAKWAVNELVNWKNQERIDGIIRIHGTHDKLIPWKGTGKVDLIEAGEHFMIVDRAQEVSDLINKRIVTLGRKSHSK